MIFRALEDRVQPPVATQPGEGAFNHPADAGWDEPSVAAAGSYALTVTAANTAGHVSTATASFVIDLTPPQIAFSGVTNGQVVKGTAAVSVAITSLYPGTSTFLLVNQTFGSTTTYAPGATITLNGIYVLTATATDLAGNVAASSITFRVEMGPLAPTSPALTLGPASAQLAWGAPESDVLGYRV